MQGEREKHQRVNKREKIRERLIDRRYLSKGEVHMNKQEQKEIGRKKERKECNRETESMAHIHKHTHTHSLRGREMDNMTEGGWQERKRERERTTPITERDRDSEREEDREYDRGREIGKRNR